jgi:hypothetical protein
MLFGPEGKPFQFDAEETINKLIRILSAIEMCHLIALKDFALSLLNEPKQTEERKSILVFVMQWLAYIVVHSPPLDPIIEEKICSCAYIAVHCFHVFPMFFSGTKETGATAKAVLKLVFQHGRVEAPAIVAVTRDFASSHPSHCIFMSPQMPEGLLVHLTNNAQTNSSIFRVLLKLLKAFADFPQDSFGMELQL